MDCCLAAKILKYNKTTILNNCVCIGIVVSFVSLTPRHQCDSRKPIYRAGNRKHITTSEANPYILPRVRSKSRKEEIASRRREMHRKHPGMATIAPRSTTEAIENVY